MIEINGKYTTAKIMIDNIDESCMGQIVKMINHEAFTNPVAIMPDTHAGKGSVIGFTMPVGDKLVPNVVGVDLNCGMMSFDLGIFDINHEDLDKKIRESIPFGINVHYRPLIDMERDFHWGKNELKRWDWSWVVSLCERVDISPFYIQQSLGTVGGGNHFLEFGKSVKTGHIWVTVHSGSRNLGKKICEFWQKRAGLKNVPDSKTALEEIKKKYPKKEWENQYKTFKESIKNFVTTSDLDFIEGKDKDGYIEDMKFTSWYANQNRFQILKQIVNLIDSSLLVRSDMAVIETVHNYVDLKDNIIRKGAIRSYIEETMIIPLNREDGILICKGKSNPEWNFSAPHGSGRILSRSKAKETLNLDEYKESMKNSNVFSTDVSYNTIDESKQAYKDSNEIIKCIGPTAEIIDRLIPIHSLKDSGDETPWKKKNS